MQKIHESIDVDYVRENMFSDYLHGWCIACGAELVDVERFERDQPCCECGANGLYGSYALVELLTGERVVDA